MIETKVTSVESSLPFLGGVGVIATGGSLREAIVTNQQLERTHGVDPKWILDRTGIQQRSISAASIGR